MKTLIISSIYFPFQYLIDRVAPVCRTNNCSELLTKVLYWHLLPESRRIEQLPLEQTADRLYPMKMTVYGIGNKKDVLSMETYCFCSQKWTIDGHVTLPDTNFERHLAIIDQNVYIFNGNGKESGAIAPSQTVNSQYH